MEGAGKMAGTGPERGGEVRVRGSGFDGREEVRLGQTLGKPFLVD